MDNRLQIFKNEDLNFEVKMKIDNGEEVFDVETVARSLGLVSVSTKSGRKYENVRWTRVNEYLKLTNTEYEVKKGDFISEPMVYKLAFKANNEVAENFQDWLAIEVLPQIRKTGGYIPLEEEMSEAEIMAKALLISQKTIEKKDELLKAKTKELEEKNRFINQIALSQNSLKVEEVAQIASKEGIKIGRNRLWDKLREWGLIKQNSKYDPKQKYIDSGYFEVVEGAKETYKGVFTYKTTKVTGKGQVYIINKLIKESKLEV